MLLPGIPVGVAPASPALVVLLGELRFRFIRCGDSKSELRVEFPYLQSAPARMFVVIDAGQVGFGIGTGYMFSVLYLLGAVSHKRVVAWIAHHASFSVLPRFGKDRFSVNAEQ